MKRMLFVIALTGATAGASGCCCCRALWPQTAAVAPVPVAACPPPAYDPCATPPVAYGAPPVATYAPGASYAPGAPVYTPAPQW